MFKNSYTTRMSSEGKVLERRFNNIVTKSSIRTRILAVVCVCAVALFVAGVVLLLSRAEFARVYDMDYYAEFVESNDFMPKVDELGEYNQANFTHYHNDMMFGFESDTYTLIVKYEIEDYALQHGKMMKYGEDVSFSIDGFDFKVIETRYSPKEMFFVGTSNETCEIAYVYFYDDDLDYIDTSYAEFLVKECGWQKRTVNVTNTIEVDSITETCVSVLCNGHTVHLSNAPFFYNGEIYVPVEELFENAGGMVFFGSHVRYEQDKVYLSYTDGDLQEYEMQVGKNYIDGDNEFMPVTKPTNAPLRYNEVVYIPVEYLRYMKFYNINFDYRLTGESPLIEKLEDAIEFEIEEFGGYTQYDLNMQAYEEYENWNRLLSEIIAELTENELTEINQPQWVESRDKYMEDEASPYEGGSMQPMMRAEAGSYITRKRCEQLILEFNL